MSWLASIEFGCRQLHKESVSRWAEPCLEAFCAGVWFVIWTADILLWIPKPRIIVENGVFGKRLHCSNGAACSNEIEDLYFLHGVLVPAYAVLCPDQISLSEIHYELNEEVKRTLIEQFGWERFLRESGAKTSHRRFNERDGQWEHLYRLNDGTQRIVLIDPSTGRKYALGIPSDITTCEQAQNWMSSGLDRLAIHRS